MKCIEDEIPFEVPEGWAWARLNALSENITDGDHQPPPQTKSGIPFLVITNVSEGSINFKNTRFVSQDYYDALSIYRKAQMGDLLFTVTGSYGIPIPVESNQPFCFQRHIAIIRPYIISNYYLNIVLASKYIKKLCDDLSTGTAQKTVGLAFLRNFLIPVPSLSMQSAIVTKTNELLASTLTIQKNRNEIIDTIKNTKYKILDLAIRGKLVPQDPNDEPASVLLERIRAEREELIKQGKIKRDKKESVIFKGDDNSYYDCIPETWAITSLSELTTSLNLNDGNWILSENMAKTGEVKLIQLGSIGNMKYLNKGYKFLTNKTFEELNCTQIFSGYMLINRIISDWMCACILPSIDGKLITTVDTCWIAPHDEYYNLKYLLYAISSPVFQSLVSMNTAGTTRKRISKKKINCFAIPFTSVIRTGTDCKSN